MYMKGFLRAQWRHADCNKGKVNQVATRARLGQAELIVYQDFDTDNRRDGERTLDSMHLFYRM